MVQESPKYTKKVDGYTKWLRNPDVKKRRKAARMVGELGAEHTIPQLQKMAATDPDSQVRSNALYALGMFAAARDALESDDPEEQDAAVAAIQRMTETGQIGKVAKQPPGWIKPTRRALSVLLVVLLVGNGVLFFVNSDLSAEGFGSVAGLIPSGGGGGGGENTPDGNGGDADSASLESLVRQAQSRSQALQGNIGTLRQQYQPLTNAEIPADACPLPYNNLEPLTIAPEDAERYPEVALVYDEMNAALETTDAANQTIRTVCRDRELIPAADAEQSLSELAAIESNIEGWAVVLEDALIVPTETPVPTQTAVPTEVPTDAPTATPTDLPQLNRYVAELRNIIDQANSSTRSPGQLLTQYYRDALANNGDTDGCRTGNPGIPPNYTLPPGIGEYAPELANATEQVNRGLQTLRDAWATFEQACEQGPSAVLGQAQNGLLVSSAVEATFDVADQSLQTVLDEY